MMRKVMITSVMSLMAAMVLSQSIQRTVCQGNRPRLDSLLDHISINTQDERGRSLLHWAVACKQENMLDFLLEKGIDINIADHQGKTPMHVAVQFKNLEYVDMLSEKQQGNKWIDQYGMSLLEGAILKRDTQMIDKLLDFGVEINDTNSRGSTPLEIAQKIGAHGIANYLLFNGADNALVRQIELRGEYMGQKSPTSNAELFAPNFISTEAYEFGSVFNRAGTEFYYGVDVNGKNDIRFTKKIGDVWSKPEVILSHERYGYNDPFLSPDESRLYFISNRALDGVGEKKSDIDIWYVERTTDGWSEPINAGPNINSNGNEYYISFTIDGSMYFSSNKNAAEDRKFDQDIYVSPWENGKFQEAVNVGDSINTDAYEADVFIDPNEEYIIFCSTRENGYGRGDLYISFKNEHNQWSLAKNMGQLVNSVHHEFCPFVTGDGKYLFYTSNEDIYWIGTEILKDLR